MVETQPLVSVAGLQAHAAQWTSAHVNTAPVQHAEVMSRILQQVQPMDFRKEVGLEDTNEKLKQKHYLVTVVDHVLALAQRNSWGLCRNNGLLYAYNGAYWKELPEDEVTAFLGKAAEKMSVDKYDARLGEFQKKLYQQFQTAAYLPAPAPDRESTKINLANGTFEITTAGQSLRGFDRADFLRHQLPFDYDPIATAPRFKAFLEQVQPDADARRLLAEYMGYVFVHPAKLKLEKVLLLYGSGANGKSVFYEIIKALMGSENVSHYSLQSLTSEQAYCRAHLGNKLVNYASEINGKLESNAFKQLASGEEIEARLPYGQPFIMTDYAKLIFNCNELPADVEHTPAYFRRFLIVPFNVTIPEAEQDRQLAANIIQSELSGVFNWVLDGLRRLLAQGRFTDCEAVRKAVEAYKVQSDSVKTFLDEMEYQSHADRTVARKVLYSEYKVFCQEDGYRPVAARNFAKRLEGYGIDTVRRNGGWVHYLSRPGTL